VRGGLLPRLRFAVPIRPSARRKHAQIVCPGRGVLTIEYPSHRDRVRIEELLGGTFYGVPYKGVNY
jgi:hypothetical protein